MHFFFIIFERVKRNTADSCPYTASGFLDTDDAAEGSVEIDIHDYSAPPSTSHFFVRIHSPRHLNSLD